MSGRFASAGHPRRRAIGGVSRIALAIAFLHLAPLAVVGAQRADPPRLESRHDAEGALTLVRGRLGAPLEFGARSGPPLLSPPASPQRGRIGHEHSIGCRVLSAALEGTAFALAAGIVAAPLAIVEMDADHPERRIIRIQVVAGAVGVVGGFLAPVF